MITYEFLQNYWWLLISILGAALVFLLFVQGGQSMLATVPDKTQRSLMVNSLGKKWELTFTTLVVFGGAFFASFPLFYSTSFGGAYWLWMLILFSFVGQAVSFKYRKKEGNIYGTRTYDILLCINGIAAPVLLGVAVAMMFFGAEFTVEKTNLLNLQSPVISRWSGTHGLEAVCNIRNISLGITVLFLARTLASLYFINNINDNALCEKQRKALLVNSLIFVPCFLLFLAFLFTASGIAVGTDGKMEWMEYKYLDNDLGSWWILSALLAGTLLVLFGIGKTLFDLRFKQGFWFAGSGTVLVVLALFWTAGYNGTAYFPSLLDTSSSLTIRNSSSSEFTLTVMSIVSLLVPFVIAYIAYAWRALDHGKLTAEEIDNEPADNKY